jgi:hypothetical protein
MDEYGLSGHGAAVPRGLEVAPERDPPWGRFGWMFPGLAACDPSDDAIEALVRRMRRQPAGGSTDNPCIPAGFTYLGQFIDHDITFDAVSSLEREIDPDALVNFRTPRLDLDSLYGSGPEVRPYLYDWKDFEPHGTKLLVARNDGTLDLPRNHQGRALVGDPRNDENAIVAQLHLLFIRFHNAVVDRLGPAAKDLFETAQRIVRWHYQWIVVHEFLPKIVGRATAEAVLTPAPNAEPEVHLEHFTWEADPFIPVEFSGAAYRFGHSMARSRYAVRHGPGVPARTIFPELAGLTWLVEDLVVDWGRFFKLDGEPDPQDSSRIDPTIANPLFDLPGGKGELPRRNLRRGKRLGLPSGQAVADEMELALLAEADLSLHFPELDEVRDELVASTPLWYYLLCEAAKAGECDGQPVPGAHLGPVGGRIVAEVLVGLLVADATSYLSKEPTWEPELGTGGRFTMADLIEFVRSGA